MELGLQPCLYFLPRHKSRFASFSLFNTPIYFRSPDFFNILVHGLCQALFNMGEQPCSFINGE